MTNFEELNQMINYAAFGILVVLWIVVFVVWMHLKKDLSKK